MIMIIIMVMIMIMHQQLQEIIQLITFAALTKVCTTNQAQCVHT